MKISRIPKLLLRKLLGLDIYRFHYLVFDTSSCPKLKTTLPFKVKDNLSYSDFETGDKFRLTPSKEKIIKDRLQSPSYKCFGIIEKGKLLYSTWVALDRITLPNGLVIPLKEHEAILEDSFCEPIARGRHFHSIMNLFRLDYLASLGKKKIIAIVLDGNVPAMKVQMKSGFKEIRTFYSGTIFGRPFSTLH